MKKDRVDPPEYCKFCPEGMMDFEDELWEDYCPESMTVPHATKTLGGLYSCDECGATCMVDNYGNEEWDENKKE